MDPRWRGRGWGRRRTRGAQAPGVRDRAALGRAMRAISAAPDLAGATAQIAEEAAWLLRADGATVVRDEQALVRVLAAVGGAAPSLGQSLPASGALSAALRSGAAAAIRSSGMAEAACPIDLGSGARGAIVVSGPARQVPRHAQRAAGALRRPRGPRRRRPTRTARALPRSRAPTRSPVSATAGPSTPCWPRRSERASRHDDPLSLVLLDIDHFKGVNDHFGHQLGDRVLVEVGRRLVAIARRGEAVTRIGGEEFAWILPRTDAEGTAAAAARALAAISGEPFEGVGRLTISAGVCDLAPAGDADAMVRLADRMLYRAKADGRNAVRSYTRDAELAGTA